MLHFQDDRWLLKPGSSYFSAYITAKEQKPEDVSWTMELSYMAGGAMWRRVNFWERPSVDVSIRSFQMPGPKWTDFEHLDFWSSEARKDDGNILSWLENRSGTLDVFYRPKSPPEPSHHTTQWNPHWRVARREGARFTVELACVADGRNPFTDGTHEEVRILSDGTEERVPQDAEFWKANSQLYCIEEVPFGVITVRVPRNVADPELYAIKRARFLTGAPEPEHLVLLDYFDPAKEGNGNWDDVSVELQYHGYYEG